MYLRSRYITDLSTELQFKSHHVWLHKHNKYLLPVKSLVVRLLLQT